MKSNDITEIVNQVLEQLSATACLQGRSLVLNFIAPGAQYVNTVESQQIFTARAPRSSEGAADATAAPTAATTATTATADTAAAMPEALATGEAQALWQKVRREGLVDEGCQPLLSRTQAALLADAMATRLDIRDKWKVFEAAWHRKNMRSDYNAALGQRQSLRFQDRLKTLLAD